MPDLPVMHTIGKAPSPTTAPSLINGNNPRSYNRHCGAALSTTLLNDYGSGLIAVGSNGTDRILIAPLHIRRLMLYRRHNAFSQRQMQHVSSGFVYMLQRPAAIPQASTVQSA